MCEANERNIFVLFTQDKLYHLSYIDFIVQRRKMYLSLFFQSKYNEKFLNFCVLKILYKLNTHKYNIRSMYFIFHFPSIKMQSSSFYTPLNKHLFSPVSQRINV